MTLERVAPGVDRWVMPEASMGAVVVADAGEALVVDAGTLPSRAAELRAAIEARGDRIVAVAITHAHWDHCFALSAFAGLPMLAHPAAIDELREHGEAQRTAVLGFAEPAAVDAVRALPIVLPDVPVPSRRALRVGGSRSSSTRSGRPTRAATSSCTCRARAPRSWATSSRPPTTRRPTTRPT